MKGQNPAARKRGLHLSGGLLGRVHKGDEIERSRRKTGGINQNPLMKKVKSAELVGALQPLDKKREGARKGQKAV